MSTLKERAAKLEIETSEKIKDGQKQLTTPIEKKTGKNKETGNVQNSDRLSPAYRPAKPAEASLVLPHLDEKAADVLERGMKAQAKQWDVNAKDWVYCDDIRAQLEAVKLFYAYKFGMPVQRQIKIEANFKDNEEQILALVQSSPEAKRELIKAGVISESWIETKAKRVK